MYEISGTKITLTRGDSFAATISMKRKGTGEDYTPQEGDEIRFGLKRNVTNASRTEYVDKKPLLSKTIPIATLELVLEPEDTKTLSCGEYAYDIEITFADGRVDTFINNAEFNLVKEVI